MEKEFIPYEQALDLKELGFREECSAYYSNQEELCFKWKTYGNMSTHSLRLIQAPTFSQAFRWFREKYDLHGITFKNRKNMLYNEGIKTHSYTIMGSYNDILYNTLSNEYKLSFEETELECLKELIEIVKNK